MSIKFIKVRFNLNNPNDRKAYDIIKKVSGQNTYIKNAIIALDGQKQDDSLVEKIVAAVRSELSKVQTFSSPVPFQMTEPEDKDSAEDLNGEKYELVDEVNNSLLYNTPITSNMYVRFSSGAMPAVLARLIASM